MADARPFWSFCAHTQMSPPDEMGDAICADCGGTVRVVLTRANLAQAFDFIERDRGSYGRHSRACVNSDLGWVCASDCRLGR